jgi:hypothetical protein
MNRTTVTDDGKTKIKETALDQSNIRYGIHFFSKHKDVLTAALEKKTKYDDQMILELYKYKAAFQKLSTKETELTHVCFACRRLFNDTEIDEYARNGTGRNGYDCKGKIRIHSAEQKWIMHENTGRCTRASRLKALHTFMIYESGSDLLKSKVTDAEKIGLVEPVEKRGRKIGTKLPPKPPKIIETIKLVELPATPIATLTVDPPDESAELKKLKEEVKYLQLQLKLCEIANEGYQEYKSAIEEDWKDSETALKREKIRREKRFIDAVEQGLIEDIDDAREDLGGY